MHTLENKNRIVIIDALRGFAIAAILLIHTSNHFLYHSEQISLLKVIRFMLRIL